jgi:hypothetical protein
MEMMTLRRDWCPKVEFTVGTKDVKKTMHSCWNAGFVPHGHCTHSFAHVQGNKNCKVDMELFRTDILDVKLPESSGSKKGGAAENARKQQ